MFSTTRVHFFFFFFFFFFSFSFPVFSPFFLTLLPPTCPYCCRFSSFCSSGCRLRRSDSEGKNKKKGGGNFSEESGDDLEAQASKDALDSFAIDLHKGLAGGGGAKKKTGGKKKGKGKKK